MKIKQCHVTWKHISLSIDFFLSFFFFFFLAETLCDIMGRHDIFKVLRGKNVQTQAFYPERLTFRIEGEIRNFSDKQRLTEFISFKRTLQGTL